MLFVNLIGSQFDNDLTDGLSGFNDLLLLVAAGEQILLVNVIL